MSVTVVLFSFEFVLDVTESTCDLLLTSSFSLELLVLVDVFTLSTDDTVVTTSGGNDDEGNDETCAVIGALI